ncbi:hypothetical protein EHS25_006230 [Saitozyma podzolica]|uniref:CCHC-type domain-containing protein n=1 Tax=Saitozyma podzolica TaxID=1890683 RepID=A0A427XS31_9TREE|nr:hypothetical protein EHS25_006230 [Saitozyma podzolica]
MASTADISQSSEKPSSTSTSKPLRASAPSFTPPSSTPTPRADEGVKPTPTPPHHRKRDNSSIHLFILPGLTTPFSQTFCPPTPAPAPGYIPPSNKPARPEIDIEAKMAEMRLRSEAMTKQHQRADDDRREYEERLAAENAESERRRTATEAAQREVDRAREEARQRKLTSRAAWDDEKKTHGPRRDVDIEGQRVDTSRSIEREIVEAQQRLSQLLLQREQMRDSQVVSVITPREQKSREVYSPGYGIRGAPKHQELPPPDELVRPEGSVHRIYPAPSPVAPPLNSGSGWGGESVEAAPRVSSRVSSKAGEPSPDSSWEAVPRDVGDRSNCSTFPGRDPPPHISGSTTGPTRSPNTNPTAEATEKSPPPSGGAYIAWQPVQYENPDLNQPHEISNDELLKGLEGMRREGRGEPHGPAPMGSSGDSAKDNGWASRARSDNNGESWVANKEQNDAGQTGWGAEGGSREGWAGGGNAQGDTSFDSGYGGRGDNDGCRICHEQGHFARECPKKDLCHKCGEPGHISRECPNGGGGGRSGGACYKCGEEGHISRDCPNGGGRGGGGGCFNCGEGGISPANVPSPAPQNATIVVSRDTSPATAKMRRLPRRECTNPASGEQPSRGGGGYHAIGGTGGWAQDGDGEQAQSQGGWRSTTSREADAGGGWGSDRADTVLRAPGGEGWGSSNGEKRETVADSHDQGWGAPPPVAQPAPTRGPAMHPSRMAMTGMSGTQMSRAGGSETGSVRVDGGRRGSSVQEGRSGWGAPPKPEQSERWEGAPAPKQEKSGWGGAEEAITETKHQDEYDGWWRSDLLPLVHETSNEDTCSPKPVEDSRRMCIPIGETLSVLISFWLVILSLSFLIDLDSYPSSCGWRSWAMS